MANSDVQAWAPDPSHGPGESGERGSSAMPGTAHWTDGTGNDPVALKDGFHAPAPTGMSSTIRGLTPPSGDPSKR